LQVLTKLFQLGAHGDIRLVRKNVKDY